MIDFNKLNAAQKTEKVTLGEGIVVTVGELPISLLLKFKSLRTFLASAVSKFTQQVPLSAQKLTTEKMPLAAIKKDKADKEAVTETVDTDVPDVALIDKAVQLKQEAFENVASMLLDADFFYDVLVSTVREFKDVSAEELLGDSGLSVRHTVLIASAILKNNSADFDKLGNFWSLLKGQM